MLAVLVIGLMLLGIVVLPLGATFEQGSFFDVTI